MGDAVCQSQPLRTLRGVFWTAEEEGLLGARRSLTEFPQPFLQLFLCSPEQRHFGTFFLCVGDRSRSLSTDQLALGPPLPGQPPTGLSALPSTHTQTRRMDDIVRILNAYDIPLSVVESNSQGDVGFWADDGVPSVNFVADKGLLSSAKPRSLLAGQKCSLEEK